MKKRVIYLITLTLILLSELTTQAQQLPLFSQYLFNGFIVNPAYAGLDGLSTVNAISRDQWAGLPYSPKTQIISFQTRLVGHSFIHRSASVRRRMMTQSSNGRVGIGGYIYNDRTGLINRTGAQFTYAYHIKMDQNVLSMALNGSISEFSIDRDKIKLETSDKLIDTHALNMFLPDMGFGVVYSNDTWYAGLSADQLFQAYLKLGSSVDKEYRLYSQFNLTGGYRYDIDEETALEPSILVKTTFRTTQMDISAKVHFITDYWAGLSYRTGSALIFIAGAVIDPITVGISYDYNLSSIRYSNYGSFELMAAYKFGNTPNRLRWLNR